jgi:hypothetical protein
VALHIGYQLNKNIYILEVEINDSIIKKLFLGKTGVVVSVQRNATLQRRRWIYKQPENKM